MAQDLLSQALTLAIRSLTKISGTEWCGSITPEQDLSDVAAIVGQQNIHLDQVLSKTALHIATNRLRLQKRDRRNGILFVHSDLRPAEELVFTQSPSVVWSLKAAMVERALLAANLTIEVVHDLAIVNDVPLFKIMGLRNLSSFVGEIFAAELQKAYPEKLFSNPNQDGYPDLCAYTPEGKAHKDEYGNPDKEYWSWFKHGGIEVKSTCGNTPPAKLLTKPLIGEERYSILESVDWKSHHRETNNLLGIYWDFIDGLPMVLAAFFRNDLDVEDWGKIVQPKEEGGRTTSVSVMKRAGVKKMGLGWIVLPLDSQVLPQLAKKKIFALPVKGLERYTSHSKELAALLKK